MSSKVDRAPDFSERLEMACEQQLDCPPSGAGRYQWIVERFHATFAESVSTETVTTWFSAESRPTQDMTFRLAQILKVDGIWLDKGLDEDLKRH